jgi:glycosyltransferase involved in cell wall biosynthesis
MKERQPTVSILLLAYQQARLVRAAVEACLAQEGGPYEIILSDDASTDGTFEAMQSAVRGYDGHHHVVVRRNATNLGIGRHYNELVKLARGELLVTAAADDISVPDRVRQLELAWVATDCRADLVASHVFDLDDAGRSHGVIAVDDLAHWRSIPEWIRRRPYVIGAGHAFTKRVMQRFGPFAPDVAFEDQILSFRAIAMGGAITVPRPLVHYRRGGTSRCPEFETAQDMFAWKQRQSTRELAVMRQLLADARTVGHEMELRESIGAQLSRAAYMQALGQCATATARLRTAMDHPELSAWWRYRRALQATFPDATFAMKSRAAEWRTLLRTALQPRSGGTRQHQASSR